MISSSSHTPRIRQEARIRGGGEGGRRRGGGGEGGDGVEEEEGEEEREEEEEEEEREQKNESKALAQVQIILQYVGQVPPSPQYFL